MDPQPSEMDVVDAYGQFMRALHVARLGPWADLPLTLPQLRLLGLLCVHRDGLSGREIASALRIGPSAVTPVVDRLVEHGYARRVEDPVDRRITRLFATDAGLDVMDRVVAGRREHMAALLARLEPDELRIVQRAFLLLSRAASDLAKEPDAACDVTPPSAASPSFARSGPR